MLICSRCKEEKDEVLFHLASTKRGYTHRCKVCNTRSASEWQKNNKEKHGINMKKYFSENPHIMQAVNARRRAIKLHATPSWSDPKEIENVYFACDLLNMVTGEWHEVDHIIPLQHKLVCGLHIVANLQILTKEENRSKSNTFCIE